MIDSFISELFDSLPQLKEMLRLVVTAHAVGAFMTTLQGVLFIVASKVFLGCDSATFEVGAGPNILIVSLNKFRYKINYIFIPASLLRMRSVSNPRLGALHIFMAASLLVIGVGLIYATLCYAARIPTPPSANKPDAPGGRLVIDSVKPGSAAEKIGLREGMIISQVNGQEVRASIDLAVRYFGGLFQAQNIRLSILDGSREVNVLVPSDAGLNFTYYHVDDAQERNAPRLVKFARVIKTSLRDGCRWYWHISGLFPIDVRFASAANNYLSLMAILSIFPLFAVLNSVLGWAISKSAYPNLVMALLFAARPLSFAHPVITGAICLYFLWTFLRARRHMAQPNNRDSGIMLQGYILFLFTNIIPFFTGMYIGLLSQISQSEGLKLFWTFNN
jgi:hypothetical protein